MFRGQIIIDAFRLRSVNSLVPFNLDVYKYQATDFLKSARIQEEDFSLDILDVAYYTGRTICTYTLTNQELYFDIISSLLSHLNFVDLNNNNLTLSESRYKRLRDFSKSTRIGEMAQGINTYFVTKRLGFPYFIDYDLAKEKTNLGFESHGKSPDFVILNSTLTKVGLYESKGNMNGNATNDLLSAFIQINDVYSPPCIDCKTPVSLRFQNNNDHSNKKIRKIRKSSINYAFVETDCSTRKENIPLKKLHYASWFYLVGDFSRVQAILEENNVPQINENDTFYELDNTTDKKNPIYWVKQPLRLENNSFLNGSGIFFFLLGHLRSRENFKIGIYKKIIDSLVNEVDEGFQLPEENIAYLKKYPDGTLLYFKEDKL
ncbi:hypothetical protein [Aestuariibaculum lutulentum]|uniref:Uncharacterized protein n=1 Tax=Aestuariibaculum lutulentum TaxID=2920935 RepID=A0ABS9RGY3_9FLAO|nr:hypothetical protein [Aestuariibaculum lutulentum]MCH4552200.1 hypothetical protein [Aestuariibaculum lutulentum]